MTTEQLIAKGLKLLGLVLAELASIGLDKLYDYLKRKLDTYRSGQKFA